MPIPAQSTRAPTPPARTGSRETQQPATPSALGGSATHLLHRACQCADVVFAEETRQAGLTPRQYAVLVSVADNKDVSQTGLVAATGIDRSTLADIVKRLLAKGLIQRRRTRHDARAYAVRLTDEGRELLHSIAEAVERADARLLAGLSAQSRDQLMTALTELARAAPAPR